MKSADSTYTRALEGPIPTELYEGSHGVTVPNHGLPRFSASRFETAYPLGQVLLVDPALPVMVRLQAFNPMIPTDADDSGLPVAVLRYVVYNNSADAVTVSVCGNLPNFIGEDGWEKERNWKGDMVPTGARGNVNEFRSGNTVAGIFMHSEGVDKSSPAYGTMALTTDMGNTATSRTDWLPQQWGNSILDYWDDFSADGRLEPRDQTGEDMPMASLAVERTIPAGASGTVTFYLTWHFPNRETWTPRKSGDNIIGNYYTTQFTDAWDAAERIVPDLPALERDTVAFAQTMCESSYPDVVKEAALFNTSSLRSQTVFRTPDGTMFGWEGTCERKGCCHGSCTHVWNYEQTTPFLYGELAKSMRLVEFMHATDKIGMMSFRVNLPIGDAQNWGKAAADGQLGCVMKAYREWQLSGDGELLRELWPHVRKSLEFCWIPGGWDADKDGVMEGAQHNTMDVEYYGPNPQMGIWYLGALRAASIMADAVGDDKFAATCRGLFGKGSRWIDANLFNGEYYEHIVQPPENTDAIAKSLLIGMGAHDVTKPDFQLGKGCLVDQLVGQYMAHICGLGYLVSRDNVAKTLESIMKYNYRDNLNDHFNCMRSFALGDEAALLMASYPGERPEHPFPYFTEVMTGFEYTAAVGMLYEGMEDDGLTCIRNIRNRYDGFKRNPFDEAECGHHYARAMAGWASILAWTGFNWSAVDGIMACAPRDGRYLWSTGYAWGEYELSGGEVKLTVTKGSLPLKTFTVKDRGSWQHDTGTLNAGESVAFTVSGT